MKKTYLLTLLIVFAFVNIQKLHAQSSISTDTLKSWMVADWQRAKAYTDEYLNTMPADKFSMRAQDSIRTFAQQMLHLASVNYFLAGAAVGMPANMPQRDLEKEPTAQTKDSVTYLVNQSYDFVINGIKNMSGSAFTENATVNLGREFSFSKYVWLQKAFEHQSHHRGQTTIYIRLAGMKPPQEKLF